MDIPEVQNTIITLQDEFKEMIRECKKYNKLMNDNRRKMDECENRKKEISTEIKRLEHIIEHEDAFDFASKMEGYDTLSQSELEAIIIGMDKKNYSTSTSNSTNQIPRWIDLERLIREVIEFKKDYPNWVLISIQKSFQYDTFPPKNNYKFTYQIPQGYRVSFGGVEFIRS